jgi:hypothetical protein
MNELHDDTIFEFLFMLGDVQQMRSSLEACQSPSDMVS